MPTKNCIHGMLVEVALVATETCVSFPSHKVNAFKCANCDDIVAVEVHESETPIMKMIEAVAKAATAG